MSEAPKAGDVTECGHSESAHPSFVAGRGGETLTAPLSIREVSLPEAYVAIDPELVAQLQRIEDKLDRLLVLSRQTPLA